MPTAGEDRDPVALDADLKPVTVSFNLMDPPVANATVDGRVGRQGSTKGGSGSSNSSGSVAERLDGPLPRMALFLRLVALLAGRGERGGFAMPRLKHGPAFLATPQPL